MKQSKPSDLPINSDTVAGDAAATASLYKGTNTRITDWENTVSSKLWQVHCTHESNQIFKASMVHHDVGSSFFSLVNASAHRLTREKSQVKDSEAETILVSLMLRGKLKVSQGNHVITLKPGDLWLANSWKPYELLCKEAIEVLSFCMPRACIESSAKPICDHLAFSKVPAKKGMSRIAAEYLVSSYNQTKYISQQDEAIFSNNLINVIFSGFRDATHSIPCPQSSYKGMMVDSARCFIDTHIEDEALCAAMVAKHLDISVRYLSKLFELEPDTVCQYIRGTRLELCARKLLLGSHTRYSVKEIVYSCGYSNYSHFYRIFREYYQCTPEQYRRAGAKV